VTLLSDGNRYLETALGLLPTVGSVTQLDTESSDGPFGLSDVTVLDGLVPRTLPPGNLLIIRPSGAIGSVAIEGELSAPVPAVVDPDHRLVSGMLLEDVAILSAGAYELGPEWTPLVVAEVAGRNWPLVAEGTVDGRPAVFLAFDLRESDLPLRPAFPLFVAAAVDALAPSNVTGLPAALAPGETVDLRLSPRVQSARIVDPSGRAVQLEIRGGAASYDATDELGLYQVELTTDKGRDALAFAVNLAGMEESAVRPSRSLSVQTSDEAAGGSGMTRGRQELWWPIGLACVMLVLTEWAYDQRVAVRRAIDALGRRE
jgi:hypothetical protein